MGYKRIVETFTDTDFKKLQAIKDRYRFTWHEFLMQLLDYLPVDEDGCIITGRDEFKNWIVPDKQVIPAEKEDKLVHIRWRSK